VYNEKEYQKQYRIKNREKIREKHRRMKYKRKYNITLEERDKLVEKQNYRCAICKMPEEEGWIKRLVVDHCHVTGKVRGMLCQRCNLVLGYSKDNRYYLMSTVDYLHKSIYGAGR